MAASTLYAASAIKCQNRKPRIIVLVGLPGSGKSTFAASLSAAGWKVVSSDAHRAVKGSFDTALGAAARPSALAEKGLVVDQCSIAPAERLRLLQLMYNPAINDCGVVYFDKTVHDCAAHVYMRKGHLTLSGNRGLANCLAVVKSFAKQLRPPETDEGFGFVDTVTSYEESNALLRVFGVTPLELGPSEWMVHRFSRTPHLLDIGSDAITSDDFVMTSDDAVAWLGGSTVIVEEMVDGVNLGVSLASDYSPLFQSQSHFVGSDSDSRFKDLDSWWTAYARVLTCVLEPNQHVLFGKWLGNPVNKIELTATFIAFDVFDTTSGRYLSRAAMDELLEPTGVPVVPILAKKRFASPRSILSFLGTESECSERQEAHASRKGIYLRIDDGHWLDRRSQIAQ